MISVLGSNLWLRVHLSLQLLLIHRLLHLQRLLFLLPLLLLVFEIECRHHLIELREVILFGRFPLLFCAPFLLLGLLSTIPLL